MPSLRHGNVAFIRNSDTWFARRRESNAETKVEAGTQAIKEKHHKSFLFLFFYRTYNLPRQMFNNITLTSILVPFTCMCLVCRFFSWWMAFLESCSRRSNALSVARPNAPPSQPPERYNYRYSRAITPHTARGPKFVASDYCINTICLSKTKLVTVREYFTTTTNKYLVSLSPDCHFGHTEDQTIRKSEVIVLVSTNKYIFL